MRQIAMKCMYMLLALSAVCGMLISGCAKQAVQNNGNSGPAQRTDATQAGGGAGGGGGAMSGFRDAHKFTFQLTNMVGNISQMDKDGVAPLTAAQAKAILGILKPLRTKASMTQDEAKATLKSLKQVLTEQQLTEIGKMKPQRRRPRGQGQGQGQGMRRQGQRPSFDPAAMKNFNPFNPPAGSPMAGRSLERWNTFFASLEKKAKVAKK